jgi:hypothetical protein
MGMMLAIIGEVKASTVTSLLTRQSATRSVPEVPSHSLKVLFVDMPEPA